MSDPGSPFAGAHPHGRASGWRTRNYRERERRPLAEVLTSESGYAVASIETTISLAIFELNIAKIFKFDADLLVCHCAVWLKASTQSASRVVPLGGILRVHASTRFARTRGFLSILQNRRRLSDWIVDRGEFELSLTHLSWQTNRY